METRDAPKLRRVRRLDSIRLDKNDSTYFTNEGYLVDHPILTSCGIFEYTNPDGSIRRELRLPKYVFDENSLKTYRGKPIIITHDAGVVDKNNVDKEQIGTILSDGYEDGEDVRAEIIIHDTDSMQSAVSRSCPWDTTSIWLKSRECGTVSRMTQFRRISSSTTLHLLHLREQENRQD